MNPKTLIRKVLPKRAIHIAEETYRKGRSHTLQAVYGHPAKGLRIIGVTGTNGKTTTCNYVNEMLKSAGHKTAMFTTAVIELDGKRTDNQTHRTVAVTAQLLKFLSSAKRAQVDFVVLEVTSMAYDQHKLAGIPIEVGVITNLTQDHLDYHGTMEAYAAAKARLFNNYAKAKFAILNRDDEWYEFFACEAVGKVISYGQNADSSLRITGSDLSPKGSNIHLTREGQKLELTTGLIGEFNVYNAVAAASVGLVLGLSAEAIQKGIAALKAVPGRMESIECGQPFQVLVDYAYTPDALAKVLETLKTMAKGRVMIVFGATGNRDRSKRPIMGREVAKLADRIFLTDDETYDENPATIRRAVMEGIEAAGGADKTTEYDDRRKAIKTAFGEAKTGDVVLLAGLGHQNYREMGGQKMPWDEAEIAREILGQA